MINKKIFHTLFIVAFGFLSCNIKKDDLVGVFVSRNNINTIDTLIINSNGTYINTMYRKNDSSLIYRNQGNWDVRDNCILLKDFFTDEDDIHSKDFSKYTDVLITSKFPIERKNGKFIIHHIAMYDNIYLEKIK